MEVCEIAPGLWRWTARHPDWTPDQGGADGWEPEVASYYCEAGGDILLIDPIVPAVGSERDRFWEALDRDAARIGAPQVVLTGAWHARSAQRRARAVSRQRASWAPAEAAAGLPAASSRAIRFARASSSRRRVGDHGGLDRRRRGPALAALPRGARRRRHASRRRAPRCQGLPGHMARRRRPGRDPCGASLPGCTGFPSSAFSSHMVRRCSSGARQALERALA